MGSDKGGSIGSYEVEELGCSPGTRILGAAGLDAAGCKHASELDSQVQRVYHGCQDGRGRGPAYYELKWEIPLTMPTRANTQARTFLLQTPSTSGRSWSADRH